MLNAMELHHGNRLAVLCFDDALLARCGATIDDTEGLVNLPLGAREVVAVALFKRQADGTLSRQPAIEGRRRRARGRGALERRRPHERGRAARSTGPIDGSRSARVVAALEATPSTAATPARPPALDVVHGRRSAHRQAFGPTSHDVVAAHAAR